MGHVRGSLWQPEAGIHRRSAGRLGRNNADPTEDFLYSDGETEQRIWHITRTGDGTYEGRADDVVGVANGVARGKALNWSYDLMLKVGDSRIKVSFDDWMFLQPDGVLINKADVSKFGITIGTVTLFFQKGALPESASSGRRKTAA